MLNYSETKTFSINKKKKCNVCLLNYMMRAIPFRVERIYASAVEQI